jgi:hypothetical protein
MEKVADDLRRRYAEGLVGETGVGEKGVGAEDDDETAYSRRDNFWILEVPVRSFNYYYRVTLPPEKHES